MNDADEAEQPPGLDFEALQELLAEAREEEVESWKEVVRRFPGLPTLQGLDEIKWEEPNDARRTDSMPMLLRIIACPEQETRERARRRFWNLVFHQGDVSPVTGVVVPFLVQLVTLDVVDKGELVEWLTEISRSAWERHEERREGWSDDGDEDLDQETIEHREGVAAGMAALRRPLLAALPTFFEWLGSDDIDLASRAGELILAIDDRRDEIAQGATRVLRERPADAATARFLVGLSSYLRPGEAEELRRFIDEWAWDPAVSAETRVAAHLIALEGAQRVEEARVQDLVQCLPGALDSVRIAEVLSAMMPDAAVGVLLLSRLIAHSSPIVTSRAIQASVEWARVWRSVGESLAGAIARCLRADSDEVRKTAASALSRLGSVGHAHVDELAACTELGGEAAAAAFAALARFQDPRAVPFVRARLQGPEQEIDEGLRLAESLGPVALEVLPELLAFLSAEADPGVRTRTCGVLSRLRLGASSLSTLDPLLRLGLLRPDPPQVTESMPIHSPGTAATLSWAPGGQSVAEAIGSVGRAALEKAGPVLRGVLQLPTPARHDGEAWDLREGALKALVRMEAPAGELLQPLLDMLANKPGAWETCELLGELGREGGGALPALRAKLTDDYHWVRVKAAIAIWKISGDPEAILPLLLQELTWSPAGLEVMKTLREIGPPAHMATPKLREWVREPRRLGQSIEEDEAMLSAAKEALAAIGRDA